MAKLTVFFKGKAIHSNLFENGIVHIGRDKTNDLTIDSLAVAPAHAVMIIHDDDSTIKQLNDNFPLLVNGEPTKARSLNNNDTISLGKHDIIFNTTKSINIPPPSANLISKELEALSQEIGKVPHLPVANLQVMNGYNIGKILPLKKAMTRVGGNGSGVIVISKRKEGYFVSALENTSTITINNEPLNDQSLKLNNNDILVIDNTSLQFFLN